MGTPLSLSSDFFCVFYDSVREHGQSHHAYPGTPVCDGLFCRCAVQQLQQQQQPIQQQSELQQPEQQQLEHEQQQPDVERFQPRHVWQQQLQQQQPIQQPVRQQRVRGQPPLRLRQRAVHDLLQGHQEPPQEEGQDV